MDTRVRLARLFRDTYERLAPQFGYETRPETREFDEDSPNGRLMIAVCGEILRRMASSDSYWHWLEEHTTSYEISETGDWEYPFGVYPVDKDGTSLSPIAVFGQHTDAMLFLQAKLDACSPDRDKLSEEDWAEIESILRQHHDRACDGFGCSHEQDVQDILAELHELLDRD